MNSPKSKMPVRYYQKTREAKRAENIRLAHLLGGVSRHEEDPEGSARWIETGIWEAPKETTQ